MMNPVSGRALAGRTVLITGATSGIGYATAEAMARMGASVIVHGRNPERVRKACTEIAQSALHAEITSAVADLSSLDEVRKLAAAVNEQTTRLDILINNAGIATRKREETVDGFERQLAVNHLAPFLLTRLLLDKLSAGESGRIVNVSSNAHRGATLDLDDLNWRKRRYSGIRAYAATKLANILFTRRLAGELNGSNVTANCLHPGVVATNFFSGMGAPGKLFAFVARPLMLSSDRGAETSVYLAASDEVRGVSGEFFERARLTKPAANALDNGVADSLWQESLRLTSQVS